MDIKTVQSLINRKYKPRPLVVALERNFALNGSLAVKAEEAAENMGRYTIFVNKKHNLAHIVPKGETCHMRVPVNDIKAHDLLLAPDYVVETYFVYRLKHILQGM